MLLSNIDMVFINMHTSIWLASAYNTIRCVSIGCLMMPLITWGTSSISKNSTAHATALLTSLRTISGAIGSAMFVAIMTAVANSSSVTYGNNAKIHGLNIAFWVMSFVTLILLLIAVFGVKKRVNSSEDN